MTSNPSYRPDPRRVPVGVCVWMHQSGGGVLMIHRTGSHGEGKWSLPGGWLVPNETPEEGAAREVWEEVGVTLNGEPTFLGYTNDHHEEGIDGLTLFFFADTWEGTPRNTNPDRITEIDWWSREVFRDAGRDKLFQPLLNARDKEIVPL